MRRTGIAVDSLHIAIGWHFLYEGLWNLMRSDGWGCVSYLGAVQGPLAPVFKWMASPTNASRTACLRAPALGMGEPLYGKSRT